VQIVGFMIGISRTIARYRNENTNSNVSKNAQLVPILS